MARRKLPKLDACKLRPERLKRLSAAQLMKVWGRLGASSVPHRRIVGLVKGYVSNLAAAKSSEETYRGDPVQRRRSMETYMFIVRKLEKDIRVEQAHACEIQSAAAAGDWPRVVKLKKTKRS